MRKHLNGKNVLIVIIGAVVCTFAAVAVRLFKPRDNH